MFYYNEVYMNGSKIRKRSDKRQGQEKMRTPTASTTNPITEQVNIMTHTNHRVTIDKVTYHLQISHGSASEIIYDLSLIHI